MYLSLLALIVSVLGLVVQYFGFIVKLQDRISRLETKVELFWKTVEVSIVDMVKHPDTPELDRLLDGLVSEEGGKGNLIELKRMLEKDVGCRKMTVSKEMECLAKAILLGIVNSRIERKK